MGFLIRKFVSLPAITGHPTSSRPLFVFRRRIFVHLFPSSESVRLQQFDVWAAHMGDREEKQLLRRQAERQQLCQGLVQRRA
ncbi:hypothetical protein SUGI_0769190 [Cryptomeria japonica]|nr:hypothetical protein SUGI_0769190 [Cryptomeria japonica]